MDRQIVYPGAIPLDTDLLHLQRHAMIAIGALAQAILGTNPVADGLACTPTVPASMQVVIGPGSLSGLSALDSQAFGSLASEPAVPLVKAGINTTPTAFTLTAPGTSGQAIAWLIQASLSEADAGPAVLPYYNAAAPSQPFTGPGNSGAAQLTQRLQRVQLQCKPGPAAPNGTQAPPPIDAGWVGLYVITTTFGQASIGTNHIATLPNAPFLAHKLPRLTPGFSRTAVITANTVWTVPQGVNLVRVRLVGGGGGGGGGDVGYAGAGGGAGGYAEGTVALTPGQALTLSVGSGGAGSPGRTTAEPGTSTSFAGIFSATGGGGGGSANPLSPGGAGGQGSGGSLALAGGYGTDGSTDADGIGGAGGASAFGGGGRGSRGGGVFANGQAPGSGGGGGYQIPSPGGFGASGVIVIDY